MSELEPPAVWWSPSLDAEIEDSNGLIENAYGGYWRQNKTGGWTRIDDLPADAVRLVPDDMDLRALHAAVTGAVTFPAHSD